MNLIKESVLSVEGMTCQGCVRSVQAALRRLDGVREVTADLKSKEVRVRHAILETEREDLLQAIEAAGFTATPRSGQDECCGECHPHPAAAPHALI